MIVKPYGSFKAYWMYGSAVVSVSFIDMIGATFDGAGVNFALFSEHGTQVELCLFDSHEDEKPSHTIRIGENTDHVWHAYLPDAQPGQLYGYRVQGQSAPERGLRFDPAKVLLDPYGRGVVVPKNYDREAARRPGDTSATAMKNVVVATIGSASSPARPADEPAPREARRVPLFGSVANFAADEVPV